jgi:hypothetical protein
MFSCITGIVEFGKAEVCVDDMQSILIDLRHRVFEAVVPDVVFARARLFHINRRRLNGRDDLLTPAFMLGVSKA